MAQIAGWDRKACRLCFPYSHKSKENYSQLEDEFSCIFGIKQFHLYLFGHAFTLVADHKPLSGLLGESKEILPQASARIHHWALILAMYEYTLKFRNTTAHGNTDALSRLPLPVVPANIEKPPELILLWITFVLGHRKIQSYLRWYNFSSKAGLVMVNLP